VNYRPVRLLDDRLCPLKGRGRGDVNFRRVPREHRRPVCRRGRPPPRGTEDEVAIQEEVNTYRGVDRIIGHAFEFASSRGLRKVCMADKSNAMAGGTRCGSASSASAPCSIRRSQATASLHRRAPRCSFVQSPGQFEVIVTNNLFGDIITDIGGALAGWPWHGGVG